MAKTGAERQRAYIAKKKEKEGDVTFRRKEAVRVKKYYVPVALRSEQEKKAYNDKNRKKQAKFKKRRKQAKQENLMMVKMPFCDPQRRKSRKRISRATATLRKQVKTRSAEVEKEKSKASMYRQRWIRAQKAANSTPLRNSNETSDTELDVMASPQGSISDSGKYIDLNILY